MSKPASAPGLSKIAAQAHERICAGRVAVKKRETGYGARCPAASPFVYFGAGPNWTLMKEKRI